MLLIFLQKKSGVALSKLIYHIYHLFPMCASALPHLSWSYLGNDTNGKEKKKSHNVQVKLLEQVALFSKAELADNLML